ncbi:cuticle protein 16.8-like [Dermacentor variabilis]|uniref:cuticle protein 16.8-like n=1 Tax=Dermacentor variabilis TaxID=34621 RepID=UPI003F5B090A
MFAKVALFCFVAVAAAAAVEDYPPQPYGFSYDSTDEYGTRLTREESGDANNNKVGSYSYTDAQGISRTVRYTADAEGFHATVETNEPGTKSSNPADALYTSSAVEVAPAPAAAVVAKPVVVQSAPATVAVHATPVAVHAVHPAQYAVHPAQYAVHPAQYAVHPAQYAVHPAQYAVVHPAPFTVAKSA